MKTLCILLFAAALCACSPKPAPPVAAPPVAPVAPADVTASGQVFITMRNGNTVKLGGVPVMFYRFDVATANAAAARSNSVLAQLGALDKVKAAMAHQTKTKEAREVSWKAFTVANTNLNRMLANAPKDDNLIPLRGRLQAELQKFADRHDAVAKVNEDAKLAVKLAEAEMARNTGRDHLMRLKWPTPEHNTLTDADGNFTAKLPAGREFVAVVFASRSVGADEEKYAWAQTVPPNGKLLLSNENLFKE
jgi:hypothetical protein